MHYDRPIVLSIAGMDPCGGAGVLADIKTLEQQRCLGFAVVSAWTVQTENAFYDVSWLQEEQVKAQLKPLLEQYHIAVVKIGIIQNFRVLLSLLQWLDQQQAGIRIVWDPVLSASAGGMLTDHKQDMILCGLLERVYVVTPNVTEARCLTGINNEQDAAAWLSSYCHVLLKGGHSEQAPGVDSLYQKGASLPLHLNPGQLSYPKHGSGCILSSAIAARLAWGDSLENACLQAKTYIERILSSNDQLLAYHHV